jgi:3-oxoacyl-[acyl-carrier protein] reductase
VTARVAIVTGGARGIGRAIGLRLAAEGWSIAFCYRTSAEDARRTADEMREKGARVIEGPYDVSDPKACEALVSRVLQEWKRIDVLVNGAGPYLREPLLEVSVASWKEMFASNLDPVFYLSRLVAEPMKKQGWGRIVSFSMANADQMIGQPQLTAHYIAKVGILILTRSLARILGPHGITVNAISPGFIASGSAPDEELQKMVKNIPAGYVGELKDAVSATLFLLSDEARYVNGANIHLSGGWGV